MSAPPPIHAARPVEELKVTDDQPPPHDWQRPWYANGWECRRCGSYMPAFIDQRLLRPCRHEADRAR